MTDLDKLALDWCDKNTIPHTSMNRTMPSWHYDVIAFKAGYSAAMEKDCCHWAGERADKLVKELAAAQKRVEEVESQLQEMEKIAQSWMHDYDSMKEKYEPTFVHIPADAGEALKGGQDE